MDAFNFRAECLNETPQTEEMIKNESTEYLPARGS